MDLPKITFPCPSCDKTYLTQHSLSRHSHNHKKTSENVCPSCKVVFYRKDLLARHLKMHDPVQGGNQGGRRLRCHTACLNCREARIKCDSCKPCASCYALGKQCEYSAKSRRVSTNTHLKETTESEVETHHAADDTEACEDSGPSQFSRQPSFNSAVIDPSINNSNTMEPPAAMDEFDFGDISPGHMTAWPWLHEDLFLQQNWSGSTGFDSSFLGVQNMSQNSFSDHLLGVPQDSNSFTGLQIDQYRNTSNTVIQNRNDSPEVAVSQWHLHNGQSLVHGNTPLPGSQQQISSASSLPQSINIAKSYEGVGNNSGVTSAQLAVVSELIAYARQASLEPPSRGGHVTYWYSMSVRVREAFDIYSADSPNVSALHFMDHLIHLYWENFWSLWPMIPAHSFDTNNIFPVLYLALTSIGAMYDGRKASHFGVLLHEALRELLCEPMLSSDESDSSSLALAQARCLIQVAALYFGQKRAFSYAQHLGSVLIAQTRRMDLFSPSRHQRELVEIPKSTQESAENSKWLARWLLAESRKRLAFGILRAEVYTSVLLNARPMLCAEEVALELPCSNYLWLTKFTSDAQFIAAIRQDTASNVYEKLSFADTVRIVMESGELLPPLSHVSQELLIFGVQEHIWRLCHDHDTISRLVGSQGDSEIFYDGLDDSKHVAGLSPQLKGTEIHRNRTLSIVSTSYSLESRLTGRSRQMTNLRFDRRKTVEALWNWRQSLSRNGELTRSDRTSLMSGLLLFHISFLRIFAPIEKLHQISYRVGSENGPENETIQSVHSWSQETDGAKIAIQHACIIWSLLYQECCRPEGERAWFNFLALLGLHHAAVVIWTYAGTHDGNQSDNSPGLSYSTTEGTESKMPVISTMSRELMTMFVRLYSYISPAWSVRSSFSAAAVRLASNKFPLAQPE